MRTRVVAWSGGFDSTLVLLGLLSSDLEDDIMVISCNNSMTGQAKCDREKIARERIKEYIKFKFPGKNIKYLTVNVSSDDWGSFCCNSRGVSQPIFWVTSMIPFIPDNSTLYMGYIKSDDAMSSMEHIKDSVKSLANIQFKDISVEVPLYMTSKSEVLAKYFDEYKDLMDVCTSCENLSIDDKCGKCVPCTHMIEALTVLSLNPKYRQYALGMLARCYHMIISVYSESEGCSDKSNNEVIE